MSSLDYDNHVEVRLIKDKPPAPKSDNGIVFLGVALTLTLPFTFAFDLFPDFNTEVNLPNPVQVQAPVSGPTAVEESKPPLPTTVGGPTPPVDLPPSVSSEPVVVQTKQIRYSQTQRVQIWGCNGEYPIAANFRVVPSLSPYMIRGAVQPGAWVSLSGVSRFEDGVLWYEGWNDSVLVRSEDSLTDPRLDDYRPNQHGWIAACFVE